MKASRIHLSHDVKEERVGVVVKGLVIQKEFSQKTEVLCVGFVLPAVNFEKGDGLLAVNFVTWWVPQVALHLKKHNNL